VDEITIAELMVALTRSSSMKPAAIGRFLEAVSGSLDHELTNRVDDAAAVPITIPPDDNLFTFGIVPKSTLVDSVYASTGIPREEIRRYLDTLDDSLRPRLEHLEEPVRLEGFGTIAPQGETLIYRPVVFEQLRRD
jgi:hypothetical protein